MGHKLNIMCTDRTEHTKIVLKLINMSLSYEGHGFCRPPTLYMLPSCCNDAVKQSLSLHKQVGSLT